MDRQENHCKDNQHGFDNAPRSEKFQLGRHGTLAKVGDELRLGVIVAGFFFGQSDDFLNELLVVSTDD